MEAGCYYRQDRWLLSIMDNMILKVDAGTLQLVGLLNSLSEVFQRTGT
jgi:hypothetical protein